MVALAYAPVLILLLSLLVVGLIFATVTGGFLIVLTGAYYLMVGLLALAGQAVRARGQARRNRRTAEDNSLAVRSAHRSPPRRSATVGVTPAPVGLRRDRRAPAPTPLLRGAGSGGAERYPVIDADRSPSTHDRPRVQ